MTGTTGVWIWVAIIVVCVWMYYLYKQKKIPWLKNVKLPRVRMFEPRAETQIERIKMATGIEIARAEKLRGVLAAKRELAKARAESVRLMREIDGVSAKSVEKEKRDEQKVQDAEVEAKKVKPKRL